MEEINGKILIFTDLHLGLKSASKSRLKICVNVIKQIGQYVQKNNISSILFLGDWNHVRVSTENSVLNISYKLMKFLSERAKVYCLLGNHDIYMKNMTEINSMVIFKDLPNVVIVDKLQEVSINGNHSVLVPWLSDVKSYPKSTFDMMFGHFEASTQYLMKSYIEDHQQKLKATSTTLSKLDSDKTFQQIQTPSNSGDFIGSFVEAVKSSGTIFSGHIHKHRECYSKSRKFIFVGDPYQQNLGEKDYDNGFYVINEDNSYEFHELTGIPKHIDLKMSEIYKSFETYDFSNVTGNIIHRIYDVNIDRVLDAKISQKINDRHPYEELLSDYEVDSEFAADTQTQNESIQMIRKSKLDYVKNYIDNIDDSVIVEQKLDRTKLFNILKDYYNSIVDEK